MGGFVLRFPVVGLGLGVMRLRAVAVMAEWMLRVVVSRICSCWCLFGLEGWTGRGLKLRQRPVWSGLGPWRVSELEVCGC